MTKTTKIVVLINVIASILLAITIGTAIHAWYVRTSHTESVDVTTNGIVLTYDIDEKNNLNVTEYSISNLVFFDVDSDDEGKYFSTMAHTIQIDITNKSKKNVDMTLSWVDITSDSNPYVKCIITDDDALDSTSCTGSVDDYISDEDLSTSYQYLNVTKNTKKTFFVYIYGVQPDDSASNSFLYTQDTSSSKEIGKTYTFELRIDATISEGQSPDITQVSDESSTETESESTSTQ